jgi:hypothetical protein
MNKYEKIQKLDEKQFKLITGVRREVFEKMLSVVKEEWKKLHRKGGRKGVAPEIKLVIALEYWREYRTMKHMALDYGLAKSTIQEAIVWIEDVLIKSDEFRIPELKERFKPEEDSGEFEVLLVDVTERPTERPKYNQEDSYSGKKKDIQ